MRKLMMLAAAALIGAAFISVPSSPGFAQGGTKGVGAARTGTGPGTNAGDPGITSATGPGANPISGTATKKHAKRTRHMRSTVGSGKSY